MEEGLGERVWAKERVGNGIEGDNEQTLVRRSSILDDNGNSSETPSDPLPARTPDTIYNLFIGKVTQIIKAETPERSVLINNRQEKMGLIMLQIEKFSNLEEAWSA